MRGLECRTKYGWGELGKRTGAIPWPWRYSCHQGSWVFVLLVWAGCPCGQLVRK